MKREIENVRYHHEEGRSEVSMETRIVGSTETLLWIDSVTVGGSPVVTVTDEHGNDGIEALMSNEEIDYWVALGEIAGVLSDLEKAERMNRDARRGLTEHFLHALTGAAR